MKRWLILAAGLGFALAIAIIAYQGFGAVAQAFAAVGFGVAVVVMLRAVELAGAGAGWWIVFPAAARCPLYACVWVRFIREAINALLPVAQIGGEIAGVRVMTFFGIAGGLAGATVLVDILMQAVTLLLFTIVGIGILATVVADRALIGSLLAGIVILGLALAGFFAAQRFGGARLFDRVLMALAAKLGWSSLANRASLHDNLVRIYANLPARCLHAGSPRRLVRRRVRSACDTAADGIPSFVRAGACDRERRPGGARRRISDAGGARHSGSGLYRGLRRLWNSGASGAGAVTGQTGAGHYAWSAVFVCLARSRDKSADATPAGAVLARDCFRSNELQIAKLAVAGLDNDRPKSDFGWPFIVNY
jgi:hypothetical protein